MYWLMKLFDLKIVASQSLRFCAFRFVGKNLQFWEKVLLSCKELPNQ